MLHSNMVAIQTRSVLKYIFRFILYFGLFFVFCYFYMIDQLSDFIKDRSTITSRFEKASVLEPPTVTICMSIPLKPSVSMSYNFTSQYDIFFQEEPKNVTLPQRFENLGYLLNRDYQIRIITKTWKEIYLQEGLNDFEGYKYEAMKLKTAFNGVCYKVQPLFEMLKVPYKFYFAIKLNDSLLKMDKPEGILVYLTSNDSWQGISTTRWPQYKPSTFRVDLQSKITTINLKTTENIFLKGVKSTEKCLRKFMESTNCTEKCHLQTLNGIPQCLRGKDWDCIFYQVDSNVWSECSMKHIALTYKVDKFDVNTYINLNWGNTIFIEMWSMFKEIKEEIDVISLPNLIGSVGGSLGMFFGFSLASYILYLFDKFIDKVWRKL